MATINSARASSADGREEPPRRIFDTAPSSWQDLQAKVARAFSEMGCHVAVDRTVRLPRGSVEVDVIVHDPTTAPHSLYVCECKHWARRVPKSVVHGFRTVVTELGANRGFVTSKAGFQSGAREAANFTNIDLYDWTQFESVMFNRWLAGVEAQLSRLFEPVAGLLDVSNHDLHKELDRVGRDIRDWYAMVERYPLITIWNLCVKHTRVGFARIPGPALEVNTCEAGVQVLDTYRKLVDYAPGICRAAAAELIPFWKIQSDSRGVS